MLSFQDKWTKILDQMTYNIRLIQEKDNAALSKVIKTSLEELGYAIPGTVYTDQATDYMFSCYQTPSSRYFIAEIDGKLVGGSGIAAIPNQKENYCELQRMFLTKESRGLGIGKALMEKCISFAKEAGYTLIYIETFKGMAEARRLYEKSGFKYIDGPLGETGHFSCDIHMSLAL